MAQNYILLETISLTQSAASVTFDNIPQSGYTDLKIVMSSRVTGTGTIANVGISFNGSSSSFTARYLGGNGSSASSGAPTGTDGPLLIWTATYNDIIANTFGNTEIYIPNYTSSNYKSVSTDGVGENNATDGRVAFTATLWSNTAAITSIGLTPQSGSFVANSTFSLYGVADVNTTPVTAPLAFGGNTVSNDGTYWYHTFLTSGNFVPQTELTCDYLVVAGGGGSGIGNSTDRRAGGGGAGGLRSTVTATGRGGSLETSLSLNATAYTVIVGSGGPVSTVQAQLSSLSNGSSSSISGTGITTITSIGGGGGGNGATGSSAPYIHLDGATGGSGGGGGGSSSGDQQTGNAAGTTGQGYDGGTGQHVSGIWASGGGGGGAGSQGVNGANGAGGNGGAGVQITAFATPTNTGASSGYYAGGGAGGAHNGGIGTTGLGNNAANTGGGGTYSNAGNSGIVIIRYAMV